MQSEGGREGGNRESAGSALSTISPFLIQPICLPTTSPPLISQSHTFAVSTVSEGARDGEAQASLPIQPFLSIGKISTYHIQCVVNMNVPSIWVLTSSHVRAQEEQKIKLIHISYKKSIVYVPFHKYIFPFQL